MAQYYTLDEAARILQTTPDEMRRLAEEKKLRNFRDKGTLRFRAQEIDELARQMGHGSDPELPLGEVPRPKKGVSPAPGKRPSALGPATPPTSKKSKLGPASPAPSSKRPSKIAPPPDEGEVFDFSLNLDEEEEQVQLGMLPPSGGPSSKSGGGKKKSKLGPPSPSPKPGSDSDVRLVGDGNELDFTLPLEENTPSPPSAKGKSKLGPRTPDLKKKRPSQLGGPDSGVRIVPLDPSDSDVKMVMETGADDAIAIGGAKKQSASDSDIRLEKLKNKPGSDPSMVTEEIDLDAEIAKLGPPPSPAQRSRSSAPQLPTSSPFELSEEDLQMDEPPTSKKKTPPSVTDSSGDFELTPAQEELSPLELGSDELPTLDMDDDEVSLGDLSGSEDGTGSGINLRDPADSGISLEEGLPSSDEIELTLDAGAKTPPPSKKKKSSAEIEAEGEFELTLDDSSSELEAASSPVEEEESSEFELSLDEDSSETAAAESSEFELSLDDSGSSELEVDLEPAEEEGADSDSEFELTLDDSAGSSPLEETGEDRDIFETDFEVPALEEESGSEAVALEEDTDLESSDFDIAFDDMEAAVEDESGSQVVALDEETGEEIGAIDEDGNREFAGIGPSEEAEGEYAVAPGRTRVQYVEKAPAPWGPIPAILMLPCVVVLLAVGVMGFELVQNMLGYNKPNRVSGVILNPLTEKVTGQKLPGSKKTDK